MITRFCKWWLAIELARQYAKGWGHGVDQHRMEPESCEHHKTIEYWGEEGYEEYHAEDIGEYDAERAAMNQDYFEQNPYDMG